MTVLLSTMLAFKRYKAYTVSDHSPPGHNPTEEASLRVSDIPIGRTWVFDFPRGWTER